MVDVNLTARGNRFFRLRAPGVALAAPPLSQHNSADGAYEAAVKHAARNSINGIYTIQPPDGWEVETMGFGVSTAPPPPSAGQVWIQSNPLSVVENEQLSFTVQRGAGSAGAVAVDWSIAIAQGSPDPAFGTVNFANGDVATKTVNVQMGSVTATVSGTITLNNPRSTSGGGVPVIATASVALTVTDAPVVISDDWPQLAAGPGTDFANRLDTQAALNAFFHSNRAPVLDTAIKLPGALASMRLDRLSGDGEGATNMRIPIGPYDEGQSFWISFRIRMSPEFLYQISAASSGTNGQRKIGILSSFDASNVPWEIVLQLTQASALRGYHQDGLVSAVHWDRSINSPCQAGDILWQPDIDNGANPLAGVNPNNGAAWTACEQFRRQKGGTFYPRGAGIADYRVGIGDPLTGAFGTHSQFLSIFQNVQIGRWDQANSRIRTFAALEGQPPVLLADEQNVRLGGPGPFSAYWPTLYESTKIPNSGFRVSARTNNIANLAVRSVGLATPTGQGTITWDAANGRATFAASGQNAGPVIGFNAQKTKGNLISSAGGQSFVGVEVTGPMPSSNQTELITIVPGLDPAPCWYSDFRAGTQEPSAAGGHRITPVSQFEQQTAGLAPGQRVQITGMSGFTSANWTGAGGYIFQYGPRGHFDPTRMEVWYLNSDHTGNQSLQKEAVFSLENHVWTFANGPDGLTGPAHTYYHTAQNRKRGDRYMKPMAFDFGPAHPTRRRIHGQPWTTVAPITEGSAIGAMDWHYGLAGGGGLVWGMTAGIYTSNASVGTWTERLNFSRGGWLHPFSVSLHKRNEVYIGGGDNANSSNLRWWRVNADATVTEMPPLPKSMGVSGKAVPIEHPDGQRILVMGGAPGDKSVIVFDPATGQWSSNLGNHQFGDNGGNDYVFYVSMPEINRVCVVQSLGGGTPTFWGYRPPG